MKKFMLISSLLFLLINHIQAQKEITYSIPQWRLGVEAGVQPLYGSIAYQPNIRNNQSYYPDNDNDYYGGYVPWKDLTSFSFGLKPEFQIKKRLALTTGIRFNFYNATIESDRNFFLWKLKETETSVDYVRIKYISRDCYSLEIPLEVRLFPREKDYVVRHYFIFGTAFNFLVASTTEIEFQNPKMEKYTSNVLNEMGQPNIFKGSVYAGFGLKFGKMNYPFGNIEIHFPVFTYGNGKKDSFTNTVNIVGLRILTTLNISVSKTHKLSYTVID